MEHEHCTTEECFEEPILEVGMPAPNFTAEAFHNGEIKKLSLSDYKGKWTVLFFYPADFTFICPTELGELADKYEELQGMNVEVLSVSTDNVFVHKAWHDTSETIQKITFPMVADPTGKISSAYATLIEEEGLETFRPDEGFATRGTFIISPEGILKTMEFHDNGIGRSADELLRKIQAAQFVAEHGGEVCPAGWKPGSKTLKPGLDLVGKI